MSTAPAWLALLVMAQLFVGLTLFFYFSRIGTRFDVGLAGGLALVFLAAAVFEFTRGTAP